MRELYPELIDYIFEYCWKYYSDSERKAKNHHFGTVKFGIFSSDSHPKIAKTQENFLTNETEVLNLLKNGYTDFIVNTATRIYEQHKNELELNLCPKCGKIARTPKAKQCRFCLHDWH